jgi:hypothetical protein
MPIFHPAFYCIQGEDSLGAKAFEMVSCARFINPAAAHETEDRGVHVIRPVDGPLGPVGVN